MLLTQVKGDPMRSQTMPTVFRFLAISIIFLSSGAKGGGINIGGGFAAKCDDQKLYALDFIAAGSTMPTAPILAQATSSSMVLGIIADNLDRKVPLLGRSLTEFSKFNQNLSGGENRIWIFSKNKLESPKDQQNLRIPSCGGPSRMIELIPAIVRIVQASNVIRYEVDENVIQGLEENGALQASYTYLHEWIRDFTSDSNTLIRINEYLHSAKFFTDSGTAILRSLMSLGLKEFPRGVMEASYARFRVNHTDQISVSWDGRLGSVVREKLPDLVFRIEVCASTACKLIVQSENLRHPSRSLQVLSSWRQIDYAPVSTIITGEQLSEILDQLELTAPSVENPRVMISLFNTETGVPLTTRVAIDIPSLTTGTVYRVSPNTRSGPKYVVGGFGEHPVCSPRDPLSYQIFCAPVPNVGVVVNVNTRSGN